MIRFADLVAAPWKNGGGVTRELAAEPAAAGTDDFDWRISIADVTAGGPFSTFPGVDRVITLVEGTGMSVTVDGVRHGLVPHVPFAFSGDADTVCTLASGATRDLNLMARRGRVSGSVQVLDAGAGAGLGVDVATEPGETLLLVALADRLRVAAAGGAAAELGHLDAVRQDGAGVLSVHGKGRVALLRVRLAG